MGNLLNRASINKILIFKQLISFYLDFNILYVIFVKLYQGVTAWLLPKYENPLGR